MPFANSSGIKWSHIYNYFGSGKANSNTISDYYKTAGNGAVPNVTENVSFPSSGDPISFSDFTGIYTSNSATFTINTSGSGSLLGYRSAAFSPSFGSISGSNSYVSGLGTTLNIMACYASTGGSTAILYLNNTGGSTWDGNSNRHFWSASISGSGGSATWTNDYDNSTANNNNYTSDFSSTADDVLAGINTPATLTVRWIY